MKGIEDFMADLPGEERLMVASLRSIILDTEPRLQEKLSYGVPYFSLRRRICFLWPISCTCKYDIRPDDKTKVTLGLCYGNLLSNDQGVLLREGRKQVYVIKYASLREIHAQTVREIIQEAVLVDEQAKRKTNTYNTNR